MVASIRKLSNVGEAVKYFYYTEKLSSIQDAWHPSRAVDTLGLKAIRKETLENILLGKITEGVELGQRTKEGLKHHPGYDLTFSAPKSASIMALVIGDKNILKCHERAVNKALDYVQKHLIYTRIKEKGYSKIERTDNAIIAKYTHITSRPPSGESINGSDEKDIPDPQLHTHTLLANATLCKDGKWRSITSDQLYDSKMLLGKIYRMHFAREVMLSGREIEQQKGLMFEIKGVPTKDIEQFSRRRHEILKQAEKIGVTDAIGLARLTLTTRSTKEYQSLKELKENWNKRASGELKSFIKDYAPNFKEVKIDKKALMNTALNYAIKHLSDREAVFTEQELHSSMIDRIAEFVGKADITIDDVEKTTETAINEGKLLIRNNQLTTPENLKEEENTIRLMQAEQNQLKPIMSAKKVEEQFLKYNLNSGQQEAILLCLTTKDRVVGLQGSAGSRKSTTVGVIKEQVATRGMDTLCLAPTKAAVRALKTQNAHTLSYFLRRYEGVLYNRGNEKALKGLKAKYQKTLVVLDEASLASTSQVNKLLKLSNALGFRLVMVGDYRQLGAIPSGKPFYYLQSNGMNTCIMDEINRQENKQLLKNVYLAESAVGKKEKQAAKILGQIMENLKDNVIDISKLKETSKDPESINMETVVYKSWVSLAEKDPLIIVPSHELRGYINASIRSHFASKDQNIKFITLDSKNMTPAQMKYHRCYDEGDILRFGKENINLGIKAGDYFEVKGIKNSILTLERYKPPEEFPYFDKKNDAPIEVEAPRTLVSRCLNFIKQLLPTNKEQKAPSKPDVIAYNLDKASVEYLEVYTRSETKLAAGDRIKCTRNSQKHGFIVNGTALVIQKIDNDVVTFETLDGVKEIPLSDPDMQHIDYNYTSTVYSAQGSSKGHVIIVITSELYKSLITQSAFYVMLSRAKYGVTIIVDDTKKVIDKIAQTTGAKTSALEHQMQLDELFDLTRAEREYLSKAEHDKTFEYGAVSKDQFAKDQGIISSIAWNLNMPTSKPDAIFDQAKEKGLLVEQTYEHSVKIKNIHKMLAKSVPVKGTLAEEYLKEHRKIDTSAIKFSEDVRFIEKAYSSETKSDHPALLLIARGNTGKVQAAQVIYLDPITKNKNKSLEIAKRSMGLIKSSFVDLTTNKMSNEIFIAEGTETALSIAQIKPNARVLVSLGISNLSNINPGPSKHTILCADNDGFSSGEPSPSRVIVESAAHKLIRSGNTVSVITPLLIPGETKTDFNDVLKAYGAKKLREYLPVAASEATKYDNNLVVGILQALDKKGGFELSKRNSLNEQLYMKQEYKIEPFNINLHLQKFQFPESKQSYNPISFFDVALKQNKEEVDIPKATSMNAFDKSSHFQITSDDLKRALNDRLDGILRQFLLQGKFYHNKFYIGDLSGKPGKSLVIELSGSKKGMWHDFATGEGGNVLGLWAGINHLDIKRDYPQVVSSIKGWLGIPQYVAPDAAAKAPVVDASSGSITNETCLLNKANEIVKVRFFDFRKAAHDHDLNNNSIEAPKDSSKLEINQTCPESNYKSTIINLENRIKDGRNNLIDELKKTFAKPEEALSKLTAVIHKGTSSEEIIKVFETAPNKFGTIKNKMQQCTKDFAQFLIKAQLLHDDQITLNKLTSKLVINFNTTAKTMRDLEYGLESEVLRLLQLTDNKSDFESVKKVVLNLAMQIVDFKERFGKEPNTQQKTDFYLRARYELEREAYVKEIFRSKRGLHLSKLPKMSDEDKSIADKMERIETVERILAIDSRLATKDSIYYKSADFVKVMNAFWRSQAKEVELANRLCAKEIDASVQKAAFIAKEITKYEERHGVHMPSCHRDLLDTVGTYYARSYEKLCYAGFTEKEAVGILNKECSKLALYRQKSEFALPSIQTLQRTQNSSKHLYLQSKADYTTQIDKPSKQKSVTSKEAELEL